MFILDDIPIYYENICAIKENMNICYAGHVAPPPGPEWVRIACRFAFLFARTYARDRLYIGRKIIIITIRIKTKHK